MKGAEVSLARRRAISVLPQPVGPTMRMFLGITSSLSGDGTLRRRQRLRSATAMARLASACPTMNLSNMATTTAGVRSSSDCTLRHTAAPKVVSAQRGAHELRSCTAAPRAAERSATEQSFVRSCNVISCSYSHLGPHHHHGRRRRLLVLLDGRHCRHLT